MRSSLVFDAGALCTTSTKIDQGALICRGKKLLNKKAFLRRPNEAGWLRRAHFLEEEASNHLSGAPAPYLLHSCNLVNQVAGE